MDTFKDRVLDRLDFAGFYNAEIPELKNGNGDQATGPCPFHEDHNPSLSVNLKTGLYNCFGCGAKGDIFAFEMARRGCDFRTALNNLAHSVGVEPIQVKNGLTLEDLASAKRLPVESLKKWGVANIDYKGRPAVYIPYRDLEGKVTDRFRLNLKTEPRFIWRRGTKTLLYGLWRLPEFKDGWVLLVEGASDCWTLWEHGIPALGLPGKGTFKKLWAAHLQGFKVYVWVEPDAQELPGKLAPHIPGLLVIKAPAGFKDISEAHVKGQDVAALIAELKAQAQAPEPTGETTGAKTNLIDELNKKHAVIMIGGKCQIMNEVTDPVFDRHDVTFSSTFDFKNRYGNQTVKTYNEEGQQSETALSKLWLDSPRRRQYDGIVFSPGRDIPGYYNLFRGLAVKPVKGDCSLFDAHIKDVICNGNEEHYRYCKKWMARLVQDPGGERPGTSIALRGEIGTGKGCFVSPVGEILGSHFLHVTNQNQLTGRFNNHLKDALLVFCDEGIWAGDKTAEGVLKGMITEKYIMCEPKGKDAFAVKNHIHLIIASNNAWVVPGGFQERRFLVLDVSNRHKQDHNYFSAIFNQMDNGGREALLYDLLEEKVDIDLRKIPRTSALLDQVIYTMPTVHKFWLERLRAGILLEGDRDWEPYAITEKLFDAYVEFSTNCGERFKLINQQFGKEIKRLCPGARRGQKIIESRDRWVLYFPELDTCREYFEGIIGVKVNWNADPDVSGEALPF